MAAVQEITCKCGCGRKKNVRIADIKRGWGKYFSKSCKAKDQERRTHQYAKYINNTTQTVDGIEVGPNYNGITDQEHDQIMADCEMGWDGHKNSF